MYFIQFVTIVGCFLAVYAGMFSSDEKMQKIKADCAKEFKVDDKLVQSVDNCNMIEDDSVFNDPNAKCFMNCVLEKSDSAKGGKPTFENIKKFLNFKNDDGFVSITKECWDAKKDTDDKCDKHFSLFKCIAGRSKSTLTQSADTNNTTSSSTPAGQAGSNSTSAGPSQNETATENPSQSTTAKH